MTLELSRVSVRWFLCLLTPDKNATSLITSRKTLTLFEAHSSGFLECFITQDGCWLHPPLTLRRRLRDSPCSENTPPHLLQKCHSRFIRTGDGRLCFVGDAKGIVFHKKRSHHQWRGQCQLAEVITKGYQDHTSRKADERGLVSSVHTSLFSVVALWDCYFELVDPSLPDLTIICPSTCLGTSIAVRMTSYLLILTFSTKRMNSPLWTIRC